MNAAIILAAGESSRLGHPKQLVEIDGEPLVVRTARIAIEAGLRPYVVVGANADIVIEVLGDVDVVRNSDWARGINTTIGAGLERAIEHGASSVTVVPCDLPRLHAEDLRRLVAALEDAPIAAASYDGVVGAPASFRAECFDALRALPDGDGAKSLLRDGRRAVAEIPIQAAADDIDTEDDSRAFR